MGDVVEEIIAEPDELGYLAATFAFVHHLVRSYGWYLILGLIGTYFLLRNRWRASAAIDRPKTPQEMESWKAKEEQRLKAIQRLQQKYEEDAAIKAEKQKLLEEQKQKARLAELEKLTKNSDGHKLGNGDGAGTSKSLRPDYNPLMGNSSDSDRVCFRRPGGGSGG